LLSSYNETKSNEAVFVGASFQPWPGRFREFNVMASGPAWAIILNLGLLVPSAPSPPEEKD
jgi:hypothetical protein